MKKIKKLSIGLLFVTISTQIFASNIVINKDLKIKNEEVSKILLKKIFRGEMEIQGHYIKRYITSFDSEEFKSLTKNIFNEKSSEHLGMKLNDLCIKNATPKVKITKSEKRILKKISKDKYTIGIVSDKATLPDNVKVLYKLD
jgi:ABC-type phosphate transport system substrate-binding protein